MTRNQNRPLARSIRRVLAGPLTAGAAFLAAGAALAQDNLGEVVVTGTRIARPELEATSPILALRRDAFEAQGFENFADLATQLPQFAPSFGTSRTQSTFSGVGASGLNLANLRNLSGLRALVLVNGRRVPGGTATSTSVDFNTIPTAHIERIDVLTGGEAAVYGADAVAGVINIITRKDFEGIELNASYGESAESDNTNPSGSLLLGGDFGGRGHAMLTLQYDKQGRVRCSDRFLCAQDFFWGSPAAPLRGPAAYSGVNLNGRFFAGNQSYVRRGNSMTDANGNLIPFAVTIDGYNRNEQRDIAIPTERIMLAAEADFQVSDRVTVFGELSYGQSETDSSFEAHPFQSQQPGSLFGGGPGVAGLQATIPVNNPFVPQQLRDAVLAANPNATTITWWQRFAFFDNRGARNDRDTIRGVAGLKGDFESIFGLGSDWRWEAYYVYGRTQTNLQTEGLVGTDALYHGLRVEADPANPGQFRCIDPGARATGCIPINPFAEYTPAMVNYLSRDAISSGKSEINNAVAYVSGKLLELPAGPLGAVLGFEYRDYSGFLDHDSKINQGLVTGNQIGDVDFVKTGTRETFTEVRVPILRDLPFVQSLNVDGSYRRSNTDGVDDEYGTWKYGFDWSPVDDVKIRASRARAVRTPVPGELSGVGQTFGVVQDPCTAARRNLNPTRAANCAADGVPANYAPPIVVEQSVAGFTGGNPDLQPERGTTLTYGIVWQPSFLDGFALTVDRFDLEIDGVITTVARQTAANLCYDTVERSFCNVVTRGTNPVVPGATWVLNSVNEQLQNVASFDISGIDVNARYGFGLGNYGDIDVSLLMTFYDKAEQVPLPGRAPLDLLGQAGGSTSDQGYLKRSGVANVSYAIGPFRANWNTRYLGNAEMGFNSNAAGFPEVGSRFYHNLRLAWDVQEGTEIYAGVNNLADKDPPFFCSGCSGTQALDTIPGYYDVFGRSWYVGTRLRF